MPDHSSYKLLIVEDDPSILKMLSTFFSAQGIQVATSEDGRDVPEQVRSFQPDAIVLDVVLPYHDGFSIVEALRDQAIETPIIMLTEKDRVDDKVLGLELGADDYMTKPFSPKELHARIKAQVRRSDRKASGSTGPVRVGPFVIDPSAREVSFHDTTPVKVTKTEFDLFLFLAARIQQVVTHGELLEEVLGYSPDIETKSLVMHIANLRKKLEKFDTETVQIQAVTGVGYKLTVLKP